MGNAVTGQVPGTMGPIEISGAPVNGTTEVQRVTVNGSPGGGTFSLVLDGHETAAVAYNAAASVLQTALRALTNIGPGGCSVSGSAGGPYTVTFSGNLVNLAISTMTQ